MTGTRRTPNPWILVPALVAGAVGAGLGWIATDVSCRRPVPGGGVEGCPGWAALMATIAAILAIVGVAVVMVLVMRSVAEWRERDGERTSD